MPMSLVAIVVALLAVAALGDTRAWSGSDAGGKVATVKVMAEGRTVDPDVGYWAAALDPDGEHHPLYNTSQRGDRWIQVTSLPMVLLSVPLWWMGGASALLLLPILSAPLAGWAAGRIAVTLGAQSPLPALWAVGLGSPVAFYSLDVWEHAPATAIALLAVAEAMEGDRPRRPLIVGVLAGLAVVLRLEMAPAVLAFAVLTLVSSWRRRWRPPSVVAVAAGFLAVLASNQVLERLLFGSGVRGARAAGVLDQAATQWSARLRDVALTTIGTVPGDGPIDLLVGLAGTIGLGAVAWRACRPTTSTLVRAVATVLPGALIGRLGLGLGFIPGLLPATPWAVAGLVAPAHGDRRTLRRAAVLTVVLVLATQWTGQLVAQWAGRYLLLPGALLTVLGVVAIAATDWRRPTGVILIAISVVTAGWGLAWHAHRSASFAGALAEVVEGSPSDAVIVTDTHTGREAGNWYGERRWLRGDDDAGIEEAIALAVAAGTETVEVVRGPDSPVPVVDGFVLTDHRVVSVVGGGYSVWRFDRLDGTGPA